MAGLPNSRTRTQSDPIAEVVSAESYHAVLDTSPPDYVEKISRYLESSVGHSKQDKVSNGPAEAESDSGDSLFLTQKSVPEAVRSRRRRHYSLRSTPVSPRDLEEELSRSEDSPSSSSHEESKTDKERRRKKYTLPKYHFPFLAKRKCKLRNTLLAVQNTSLHHYVMGGFFNCVRELWQGYQREHLESSLPTVDMDGQDLSPLSEEDEERSEDEDMKVVERKRFVAPSKAKSQQTWCKQLKQQRRRKASDARQETSRGRRTKVIPVSSDTETPDHGESSCRVRGQRERDDEHATSDGNSTAQNKTPKTKRRLTRGNKASEEELCNDNDAAICEPRKPQRRHSTRKGREASTAVTEPQTGGSHVEDLFQAGQAGDGPESPNLLPGPSGLISDTNNNDSICNETKVKKRKKKKKGHRESVDEGKSQSRDEPEGLHAAASVNTEVEETPSLSEDNRAETPAAQTSEQLELNENTGMENESRDDKILRQEERDMPDSKHKRKKRKKNKSSADVRQEVDENFESDVRAEDSVFSVSCNMEDGGKEEKKKKKKKKRRSCEDVEHLQSGAVAEPLNDDAEKRKKKKRKKVKGLVITEQCEEEEAASNRTLDSPPTSTEQLEESGNCLENAAASQETSESSYVKRKKHKKKRPSSSNDASQDGEEGVDVSFCMDDSVTLAKGSGQSLKKKKKTIFEGLHISYTPEENPKNVNDTQNTKEGLEAQNAELVTKKKKIGKILSRNVSEDTVAQSDDSVSVQEKEKKRTSSFLVADAEENEAQAHGEQNCGVWGAENPVVSAGDLEQLNDWVTKRKRKMSVEQHSVDFEYPNETCPSALLELTDTGLKRKKKRTGNESRSVTPTELLESTADAGLSPAEEAVVSKKKKKKKKKKKCKDEPCPLIPEGPPSATEDAESLRSTLNTCGPVSHEKKGKHGRSAETPHDSSACDQATKETLNLVERASASPETLENQALNDTAVKKKKKKMKSTDNVLLEGKSLAESAELGPRQNKKKERNEQSAVPSIIFSSPVVSETSLSKLEMSSSDNIMKTKQRKVKRRLLNPSEDFLTDC
ncbi:hypothetical protein PFLUV_G00194710 [Perca fluviatilis]|uniref:Uncharacterized protein n=1 Tax=Perca fluviatilis TaxID=8168 RepID=A0A6A5ET30_PERFL|nr:uncharacterized protein LOC120543589 [Perca fluviatilis]KAF1378844.1 hypothetical protein PFLUV_G00194710 [Perca fluviatilis]